MFASVRSFSYKNKFRKNKMRSRIAVKLRKWGLMGVVFALCFSLIAVPVFAASTGAENHEDTEDYCMIVHEVTVGLQEWYGKIEAEKE